MQELTKNIKDTLYLNLIDEMCHIQLLCIVWVPFMVGNYFN